MTTPALAYSPDELARTAELIARARDVIADCRNRRQIAIFTRVLSKKLPKN